MTCPPGEFTEADGGARSCQRCLAGGFIRYDIRMCQTCLAGEFSAVDGALLCSTCSPGFFSVAGASSCERCARGTFSPVNGTVYCKQCGSGQYFNGTGATACLDCPQGTFFSGEGASACETCQAGDFSTGGAASCTACPIGLYSQADGAFLCDPCGPGTYSFDTGVTVCRVCENGTFTNRTGQTVCETCEAGKTSGRGDIVCTNCTAGTYSLAGMTACQACPDGTYSPIGGVTACLPCGVGTYLSGGGTTCLACAAGAYSSGAASVCTACPQDSDSAGGTGLSGCVCRAGFRNLRVNVSVLVCPPCPKGAFSSLAGSPTCQNCPAGEFSATNGATACVLCDFGYVLATTGGTACGPCQTGSYKDMRGGTQCLQCPSGSFASSVGLSTCPTCAAGSYASGVGLTMCTSCAVGLYVPDLGATACVLCLAGTFGSETGLTECDECSAGTYSSAMGLTNASDCVGCPEGYFSNRTGMNSVTGCIRCAIGKTGDVAATTCGDCKPGQFPNDPYGGCAFCPLYSEPDVNASRPEDCRCTAGFRLGYNARGTGGIERYIGSNTLEHVFLNSDEVFHLFHSTTLTFFCGDASSQPFALPAGVFPGRRECPQETRIRYEVDALADPAQTQTYAQCVPCPPGSFSLNMTAQSCIPCPNRTYQDLAGMTTCKACPSGRRENTGMPVCDPCLGRMVVQDDECRPCPEGQFYPLYAPEPSCWVCPPNMWSPLIEMGSSECRSCPRDSSGPGGTGLSGCVCAGGLEMSMIGTDPACVRCPAGKYSDTGVCLPCQNGTYSNAAGMSACLKCPIHAVAWGGATICRACVLGTVPSPDGGRCVPCPAGFFCGFGTVFACPLGTYSLRTGLVSRTQCPPCPANNFCRSPTTIQACPANTWSPPASITRHFCRCNNGWRCTYFFTNTGHTMISLTPEQLETHSDSWIAAIAQAAGVSPERVQILGMAH